MKKLLITLMIMLAFTYTKLYSQELSSSILYSTYYGDIGADDADVVAVDLDGNIYLGCHSNSTNLIGDNKQQYGLSGGIDAFVIKLNNKGNELSYLTQLGGEEWDAVQGLISDAKGNIYAVGTTYSVNFPVDASSLQPNFGGESDAFVVKLNPKGEVVWSTFLGGSKNEDGRDINIDGQGNIHVVGRTESENFPITEGALQSKLAGGIDAFITTLDSNGKMITSTYLGGSDDDIGFSISSDNIGQLYVAGTTNSINFPVKNAIQNENKGGKDIFLAVIDNTKTDISFSSYFGGKGTDQLYSLSLDSLGNAFIMGVTSSLDYLTTKGAFQTHFGGVEDIFVTKLDLKKGTVVYSTFLGGDNEDNPRNLVVNEKGSAFIVGNTDSNNFPITNLQETQISGSHDAFISMLDPSGSTLLYSSLFGGDGRDVFEGIAIGLDGSITMSGASNSTNFPLVNPLQATFHGGRFDMIVIRLLLE